jgi:hypothetical protein
MVDLNIGNFITIGLIAVLFYAVLMFGAKALGVNLSWLQQ